VALTQTTTPPDAPSLCLACFGVSTRLPDGSSLLADRTVLDRLLAYVTWYNDDTRRFRRFFDGLLRAYLDAERHTDWFAEPEQAGLEAVRQFLETHFPIIAQVVPAPDWVCAIRDYPSLLSLAPGRQFAHGWLTDHGKTFEQVAQRLRLKGSSWLANTVVQAAVDEAVALGDDAFKSHLATLLDAAAQARFRVMRDDIYQALLTRYAACSDRTVHNGLRDAVVDSWKNPWLVSNHATWSRVSEDTRQMVVGWLKQHLIRQFFEVLSEDGRQDHRRFEFWKGHWQTIDDMWFALGPGASRSDNPDMQKLIGKLGGRLLELTGTTSDTNAFIMRIGGQIVVEFNQTGNAAYRYTVNGLLIERFKQTITIHELKNSAQGEQLRHASKQGAEWEERFERAIFDQYRPPTASLAMSAPPNPDIDAFTRGHGLNSQDNRLQGGQLWILTGTASPLVNRQLTAWGFKFREDRGWWRA
jgi:hypothetical protein